MQVPGELIKDDDLSQSSGWITTPFIKLRSHCLLVQQAKALSDNLIKVWVGSPLLRGSNLGEPKVEDGLVHCGLQVTL